MFKIPDWFTSWSEKNPKDIYGPAILVGAVGSAVFVAAAIIVVGYPAPTVSTQTGPRGTGMSITEFARTAARPDPTIEGFTTSSPVPPQPGDPRAGDVIENAEPLLADLTVENYERLIRAMQEWTGIPDLFEGEETYQTVVARSMIQMTQNINEGWVGHVGETGVTCYTCHRGEAVPNEIWFKITPVNMAAAGWSAVQNRATAQSQFTSLPSDALEKLLLDGERISVHDLEPRVPTQPGDPTWQDTERTYSLMNYISNSLGVNCLFCHNSAAFFDPAQVTPQWATASIGISMVLELNNDWLVPLGDVLPESRLGPIHGDAPKAACATCHQGYSKPLQGLPVLADWPELATTGEPVYE